MIDDATQEKIELPPLKPADDTEFENVVLKNPSGAEYIRADGDN